MKEDLKDLIYASRTTGELDYIGKEKLEEMSSTEYYEGLLYMVKEVCFCRISENDKTAIYLRPQNKKHILEKYTKKAS